MTAQTAEHPDCVSAPPSSHYERHLTPSQVRDLGKNRDYWRRRSEKSEAERNTAFAEVRAALTERNRLIAAFARIFPGSHLVRGTCDTSSDPNKPRQIIRDLCCIHLPDGRNMTWHFSPGDCKYFNGIPYRTSDYDGHSIGIKYDRLEEVTLATILQAMSSHLGL